MKVAYVTTYDASNPNAWSGTGHYIAKSLERQGVEVAYIGPLLRIAAACCLAPGAPRSDF